MYKLLFLFAAALGALHAQPSTLGGPSVGYVFDARGQALRPVLGIPGAALLGDALAAAPLSGATISMRQNVAIVNDGAWKAVTLSLSGVNNSVVLPGAMPANARVAVSETGSAAAFYDSVNNVLTVVSGIAASSPNANPASLDSLPGPITRFAVAEDGSLLLTSTISGGGEALFWIGQDGSSRQLATLQQTSAILLWNAGASALVTDRGANQIWSIQNPGSNAAITVAASDADGVAGPDGAALSTDGNQLWIANTGSQNVLGINLATRTSVTLNCGCKLTTLLPMADGTSFRLNHLEKGPLWILDTAAGSGPRIVFVPAIQTVDPSAEAAQ